MLTVAIPVGPNQVYKKYLQECLDSLKFQSIKPGEVLLIDDMADIESWGLDFSGLEYRIYKNPWLCGVAHSFNFGVVLARFDLVIMLGSDDKLYSWAVEDCLKAWNQYKDPLGYYFCDVEYSDGETQACACNCAMVHKELWKHTGGFPVQSSVGACDSIFLSIILGNNGRAGNIIHVKSDKPPFWYRRHNETVTTKSGDMQGPMFTVRNNLTRTWEKPDWTRRRDKFGTLPDTGIVPEIF